MPKLSFIIPYYNTDPQIFRLCLRSIRDQTFKDYEVVVVDDGSNPELGAAARALYDEMGFIGSFVVTENQGVSAARNRGIAEASGEYLSFVDSDDMVDRDFYARLFVDDRELPAYVIGKAGSVSVDTEVCALNGGDKSALAVDVVPAVDLVRHFVGMHTMNRGAWARYGSGPYSKAIRRDLSSRHAFDRSLSFGEDTLWNLEVLTELDTVGIADAWSYGVREHRAHTSLSTKFRKNIVSDITRYLAKVHEGFVTDDLEPEFARLVVAWGYAVFRNQAMLPPRRAITPELREAFGNAPWSEAIARSVGIDLPPRYAVFAFFLRHRAYAACWLLAKVNRVKTGNDPTMRKR